MHMGNLFRIKFLITNSPVERLLFCGKTSPIKSEFTSYITELCVVVLQNFQSCKSEF